MRRPTRPNAAFVLLALCALLGAGLVVGLAGCSGQAVSDASSKEAAEVSDEAPEVEGRASAYVEFVDDYLFWGEDEELRVASIARNGGLEELEDAGAFDDDVRRLAALDGVLYVSTDGGIYRMDARDDAEDAELLVAQGGIEDFWVTSQGIIYLVEGDLYGAPVDGGDEEGLMSGVWDYVVADGSLVVLDEDGALLRCGLDGTEAVIVEEARDRYDESLLLAEGDDVYLVSDKLLVLRAGEDAFEDVGLEREIRDTVDVVIYDGGVLYEASNEKPYRHVFDADAAGDEEVDHCLFRGKPYGRVRDGLNYYTILGDEIRVTDVQSLEYEDFEADELLDGDAEKSAGASSGSSYDSDASTSHDDSDGAGSTAGYDISSNITLRLTDGLALLSTDHFNLYMPRSQVEDGLWHIEAVDSTTLVFSYSKALEAGYGGRVFTLEAFDWGDNAYADIPASFVAGLSEDKKYVVYLATDLQYDSGSSLQREQYAEMRSYAESLDMNSSANGGSFNPI